MNPNPENVIINTDDLSLEFVGADPASAALGCEMELEEAIFDLDDNEGPVGVTVHTEGHRVWLIAADGDDGALDAAIEIFGNYVNENYGHDALEAALNRAAEPRN